MEKKWIGAGAAVLALGVAWAGAGIWVGVQAEKTLLDMAKRAPGPGAAWTVRDVQHQRGLFSSSGKATLRYSPSCAAQPGADDSMALDVSYQVQHLPLPSGAARFEWQATPQGNAAETFKTLFGVATALTGQGSVGFTGGIGTDMRLPQLSVRRSGEVVEVTPSAGHLRMNGAALAMRWDIERAVLRGNGKAYDLQGLALDLDIENRTLGTGSARLLLAKASSSQGSLEGLELAVEAREKGDRLNIAITPSLKKLEGMGQALSDMRMEMAMNGLHTPSVQTLLKLFDDSCGLEALTAAESKGAAQAIETLMVKGFSLGMPKLSGKAEGGGIEGDFIVELQPSPGGRPSLVEQLRSSGKLAVTGKALTEEQRQMAINLGVAVAQADGLVASYEYAKGLLKVNNRTMDATSFEEMLQKADASVQTALTHMRQGQAVAAAASAPVSEEAPAATPAPAAAEPEEVIEPPQVPAAAPAPAPAATAPTGDCGTLDGCVGQTLAAARAGNTEAIRRLATQIDNLPKPDLGNRAVARKLNTGALEALKQGDVTGAITQLKQARSENPRDVEIVANLGFALVKANDPAAAQTVLQEALVLDPRRTSTWTPLAEAMALNGQMDQAKAALAVAFQWSANRDKSLAFYQDRAAKETRPALAQLYAHMAKVAAEAMALNPAPVATR